MFNDIHFAIKYLHSSTTDAKQLEEIFGNKAAAEYIEYAFCTNT